MGARASLLIAVAVALASAATACSILLATTREQCASDDDCARRGGPFAQSQCVDRVCVALTSQEAGADAAYDAAVDAGRPVDPRFACVDRDAAPVPTTAVAQLDILIHDFLSPTTPIPNVKVRFCPNPGDPLCTVPSATRFPNAAGHVLYDYPLDAGAFAGFLAIDEILPDGGSAYVDGGNNDTVYLPTIVYFSSTPIYRDLVDDYQLLTYGGLANFATIYQLTPDPKLGMAFLIGNDCAYTNAAGVTFTLDRVDTGSPGTLAFYLDGNIPSQTRKFTDGSGIGGFMNVPTGARRVDMYLADAGAPALGGVSFYAIANTMVFANIGPRLVGK